MNERIEIADAINLKKLKPKDETAFVTGIDDLYLCNNFGITYQSDESLRKKTFVHYLNNVLTYGIFEQDKIVGFVVATDCELPDSLRKPNGMTLAYAVFEGYRRKGVMQRVLYQLIPIILKDKDYVHCGCFEENDASKSLLIKLGFTPIGSSKHKGRTILNWIIRKQNSCTEF